MNKKVRLGYACINNTLAARPNKLGGRILTGRGVRKESWFPNNDLKKLSDIAILNAKDLLHILKWNEENNIRLFRIGSELIPWADHYELHTLPGYDEISKILFECGEFARAHGHRLTTHPGPFHILGGSREDVVNKSITSLERHSEMFDMMGFAPSYENKINIHVGGVYGDPEGTAYTWMKNWERLSDRCKARLVLENDDKPSMYSVYMLYSFIHQNIGIPITFDYFHHSLHPGSLSEQEAFEMARSTWPAGVTQCCHYSESRRTEYQLMLEKVSTQHNIPLTELLEWPTFAQYKKDFDKIRITAHADYIIHPINTYGYEVDIMIEAKAKELALLQWRNIYNYNNQQKVLI